MGWTCSPDGKNKKKILPAPFLRITSVVTCMWLRWAGHVARMVKTKKILDNFWDEASGKAVTFKIQEQADR